MFSVMPGRTIRTTADSGVLKFSRVHIVEFSSHSGVASSVALLFQEVAHTTLHMRFLYGGDGKSELGAFRGEVKFYAAFRNRYVASLRFYLGLIAGIKDKDLIWVSTGPEHNVVPDVLFLGALLVFFRTRLVLSIRDANNWTSGYSTSVVPRLMLWLRKKYLEHARRLVFETRVQERLFWNYHPGISAISSQCPTMFSDGGVLWELGPAFPGERLVVDHATLRIGLLGAVDPARRDYPQLMSALTAVREKIGRPIELVVLGNAGGPGATEALAQLRQVALVEATGGFLPQRDLIRKARSCAFLLAPLRTDKSYGSTRGTGVFGDAILSGVKVVVPSFVDPENEFASVKVAYDDAEELADIFVSVGEGGAQLSIDEQSLATFSSTAVRERLFSRLRLQTGS